MGFGTINPAQNSPADSGAVSDGMSSHRAEFWKKHPGFVWSNRQADDGVRIRAALLKPIFPVLLDIAVEFGLDRLEQEWAVLQEDAEIDTVWVERFVVQMPGNIRRGYEQACA